MRRRSERKKSSSPAPVPARRSRRSRKVSESEKTEDEALVQKEVDTPEPPSATASREEINEPRASSEEPVGSPVRKGRGSRATPKKRTEAKSGEKKVETIPEEEAENGQDVGSNNAGKEKEADSKDSRPEAEAITVSATNEAANNEQEAPVEEAKPEPIAAEDKEDGKEEEGQPQKDAADEDDENCKVEQIEEVKVPSPSGSLTASKDEEQLKTSSDVLDIQIEDVEERDEEAPASCPAGSQRSERRDSKKKHKDQKPERERSPAKEHDEEDGEEEEQKENRKQPEDKPEQTQNEDTDLQKDNHDSSAINNTTSNSTTTITTTSTAPGGVLQQQRSVKKRRWLTNKKSSDRAPPVLAISTDSLKNIIDDVVQPVPLSDVQLDSSSEEEGLVTSDRDSERSASPTRSNSEARKDRECDNDNNVGDTGAESSSAADKESAGAATVRTTSPPATADSVKTQGKATVATPAPHVVRSPSPARNRASHVLYITNLVRPFTVLQLKGLLARTGKIVDEDGFWIDRIKSKCFVAYSTEDEAIETRHALHGVRWPVSNPKCLNVDFGSRTDMDRAIQSTKDEAPRYGQENTRDNQQSGNTWSRLDATDKKPVRPVREWDVGKKEPTDHDNKANNDRRRGGSKDRPEPRSRDAERAGQDRKRSRDREVRAGRERERIVGGDRNVPGRSRSGSPVAKNKKKDNEPPIRLLDDLFRKTKGTPCIYWLPLTPEAIAEKEAFRQKRIEEHKQRMKEREDRQKERGKDRERQRDTRRNRSNERRRSRSRDRDRRRY
ncbi:apoptotic chromatin condensation inducer in the nucleus [Drosophila kikkawai]|uniref:Apoptotic chromatin condensation inducer in the nucleus n=1 Tax=Drosophila kikkawai TaxID=30033 RepID=A0ABM4GFN9_DROKI|nr:apoptotic chromatin condensation inducer in the nucleus [Drosophila kikkawai]